ncbi:nitrate/nitrite transporter [Paenibacillus sp. YPG26]|uniref:nitrate/nitrite transporter n=1 Tax=Paenibacillus sp. YPG26 TaxID=2878915 RepID=UPI00203CA5EF|nr:nitrate/nitrite transporter [Paenibacillus sp. YPG26]USB31776.1 NarK/NasA family nitrate transporter [Paenibacillus sp. YPG26]
MNNKRVYQLPLQTLSLILGFAAWVLLSSMISTIKVDLQLVPSQIAWITAIPVLSGSLLRIPAGYLTNRYGARVIFITGFLILIIPLLWLTAAHHFEELLVIGLLLGAGGSMFSIGVTSLPKYYPQERMGVVNGIYGLGNLGSALTTFGLPVLAASLGWRNTPWIYIGVILFMALIVYKAGDKEESRMNQPLMKQIQNLSKQPQLWMLSLFYFITFGSFVAFTVFLPNFLVEYFGLAKLEAGVYTACFIGLATLIRPIGGLIADKINPYILLTFVFASMGISSLVLSLSPDFGVYTAATMSIALFAGVGNGAVFKLVPMYFISEAGVANGIISALGGLGGFFPPLCLGLIKGFTGNYMFGFLMMSGYAWMCLVIALIYLKLSGKPVKEGRAAVAAYQAR